MRTLHLRDLLKCCAMAISELRRDTGGATAIITAFGSTILLGCAGLAIDVGTWQVNKRKLQGAADQAALAAALANDLGFSATTEAKAVTASYGFVDGHSGVTVTVNHPPSQGSYHTDNNAVEVIVAQVQPQYLSRFFLSTAPTASVRAVALYGTGGGSGSGASGVMCIMALDQTGTLAVESLDVDGGATIIAPDCDVYNNSFNSDGTDVTGSGTLSARNFYLSGGYETGGGGTLTYSGVMKTHVNPMPDPYHPDSTGTNNSSKDYYISAASGTITVNVPSATTSYTASGCTKTNYSLKPNNSDTLSAGVYCGGWDIKGTLTLNAGTYIIDGGSFSANSQATITGNGVTIILTSSSGNNYGGISINGGATLNLTAPSATATSGVPGIAIWEDKNAPDQGPKLNGGSTQIINGAIYLPSQNVTFNGGSSTGTSCMQLIANTITFSGNANFKHSCASAGVIDPPGNPVLAE